VDEVVKKILETLNNQIDSNELAAAVKADSFEGEYALSEDGIKSIVDQTKTLLTVNAAVNNQSVVEAISKDLYPKHMKSALSKVEEKLKPILDKLGVDYSTHEFISDAIPDIEAKIVELSGGDNKKLIESLNEDLRKAKEEVQLKEDEFNQQLKKRDEDILRDKIQQIYRSKATEKQWAEAYSLPDVQDAILGKVWNKIEAKAHLKLSENGEIVPMQKDLPEKELYDGNKVATFQSLLEPEFEPYLKKSTPENVNPAEKVDKKPLSAEQQQKVDAFNKMKDTWG
jgi:hypothetical protein